MGVERKHSKANQGGKIRTNNQNWAMPEGLTKGNAKTAADLRYPTTPIPKNAPLRLLSGRLPTKSTIGISDGRSQMTTKGQRDTPTPQEKYQISDYCWHLEPILLLSQVATEHTRTTNRKALKTNEKEGHHKISFIFFTLFFFLSAGARDKWSQSPIKETKIKLYSTLYTRKPEEIPTSYSENPN